MQLRWTALAVGALLAGAAGNAAAQNGVALTPFIGYLHPTGDLVAETSPGSCCLTLTAKNGIMVGGIGELSLGKKLALSAFIGSTVGLSQKARYDFSGLSGHPIFDVGMATTQLGGTVILRPLGRNPNGSPKVFFVEAGGAYTRLSFSETQDRSGGSTPSPTWSSGSMMALVGGGFTFRVGPRATMVLFARYSIAMKEYTSAGLTDWNSAPPPDIPKKVNLLMIGAGLRTGR